MQDYSGVILHNLKSINRNRQKKNAIFQKRNKMCTELKELDHHNKHHILNLLSFQPCMTH